MKVLPRCKLCNGVIRKYRNATHSMSFCMKCRLMFVRRRCVCSGWIMQTPNTKVCDSCDSPKVEFWGGK